MKHIYAPLALALLLAACSTTKPAPQAGVDPSTDPTVVGAVDEAAREAGIQAEAAAETGHKIGIAAGVVAAVLGGPQRESVDDVIDRYRETHDAVVVTAALIGASKGATAGAKRGLVLDQQFADLHKIEGVEVFRPQPDQIDVYFSSSPNPQMLASIAAVFPGREERALDIKAPGDAALDIRESLIELGVPPTDISAHRDNTLDRAVLRIRYRD
jgi:hypothetical protein